MQDFRKTGKDIKAQTTSIGDQVKEAIEPIKKPTEPRDDS
jgi:hypothetical protein